MTQPHKDDVPVVQFEEVYGDASVFDREDLQALMFGNVEPAYSAMNPLDPFKNI